MAYKDFVIDNAFIVTPTGILKEASLKIEDGIISKIREGNIKHGGLKINAKGRYILPGFIDMHSDAIETEIKPRPNSFFPLNIAIFELDKKLAACGITTIFHSISFAEGEIGIRSNKIAADIINEVNRLASKLNVKTNIHARFEITDREAVPYLEDFINNREIHLLSLMDHTPGQGQFKEIASFKSFYGTVYKKSDKELDGIIDKKLIAREEMKTYIEQVINLCKTMNIPLASHDDDSKEKIQWLTKKDIRITEFPVNMGAVVAAKEMGIYVCFGSPNILRGNSHSKNLSARDAILSGYGDIICSDYSPMTLLHAVFTLFSISSFHEVVNMTSLNPAMALGISEKVGSIEEGKDADIILVDISDEVPMIMKTFVSGKEVFSTSNSLF